jgi:hypothetical protein
MVSKSHGRLLLLTKSLFNFIINSKSVCFSVKFRTCGENISGARSLPHGSFRVKRETKPARKASGIHLAALIVNYLVKLIFCLRYGTLLFGASYCYVLLFDARFFLEINVLLMALNKLGAKLNAIVLMPQLLHFVSLFIGLYLLLNDLACLFVHLNDFGAYYLIDLICGHLVDQVPQLHIRLFGVSRVLIGNGALSSELVKQNRLCICEVTQIFHLSLINRLVALER